MQLLPGFRDFFPDDCARRNYILTQWREVCRRYGFVEYDGPVLEPMELYEKKSGGELVGQLFDFVDKGERHVTLRPEMTPTLARMVAARARDFKKPLKWFCAPQFFRYEKQQRGRLREFYQLNCDIIGEASAAADAELIALVIDLLRAFGFTEQDFAVRIGSRAPFSRMFENRSSEERDELLQVIDKMDRTGSTKTNEALARFGMTEQELREQLRAESASTQSTELAPVLQDLRQRGLAGFVEIDYTVVRGLAYYTRLVFEVFDRRKKERALAGGGRYDNLLKVMSDNAVDLPAIGFGMGDVVLGNLIDDTPHAAAKMQTWMAEKRAADIYLVIAKEERRPEAIAAAQQLRDGGYRVEFSLAPLKVGKQFQAAENLGAQVAALFGDEWPDVRIKVLATREETQVPHGELLPKIGSLMSQVFGA